MLKRLLGMALISAVLSSFIPNVMAVNNADVSGFEKTEEKWNIQASNGRTACGFDTEKFHSGEQSYKFSAITSTSDVNEVSAVSKIFDVEYK